MLESMPEVGGGRRVSAPPSRPRRQLHRMLILIEQLTVPGGSERQCIELARAHAAAGVDVTILALEGSLDVHASHVTDKRLTLRTIGRSRTARVLGRIHPKAGLAWEMYRLARAARPVLADVVLAHHYPAHWASARVGRWTRVPAIWLCNDWIYNPIASGNGLGIARAAKRLLRRLMIALDARAARQHDMVLTLSRMTGKQVAEGYRVDVRVYRTGATAPPPVLTSPREAREALGIAPDAFVLSTVCILMPHRRVEDPIRAVAALPLSIRQRTVFLHAGGSDVPEYLERLQQLAKESGVADRVRFLGPVDELHRAQVLAASDAFVFPVQGQSWGIAPFEAIASNVPVVVSCASGAAEVLQHGRTALLYEPGDIPLLARHLQRLASDSQLGDMLRIAGSRLWATRFTWERAARRMSRHLVRAISQHGGT